jgi:hypothetical protein
MSFQDTIACMLQVYDIQNELSNIDSLELEFTKQLLDKIDAVSNSLKKKCEQIDFETRRRTKRHF